MRSEIKIDFVDRGTGVGIEPAIRVEIKKSDDPRDKLISTLFQSMQGEEFLQFSYSNHKHVATQEGLPDMEKTVLLFKPQHAIDTRTHNSIHDNSIAFREFLEKQNVEFKPNGHSTLIPVEVDLFSLGMKFKQYGLENK